ncbi:MAG: hypothetical protein J7495_08385 [Sphingomonas sp.]|nr:hypothetical protein [Sphingomonas sp.]
MGPEGTALSFAQRLARENGWTQAHAERVILEYKKFCFLAATEGREVTPSDAVDQAWHLHLTYTRDYWERFCPRVLGCKLHHGPTAGGADERNRHFAQYAETLRCYERQFGSPPADIWPEARHLLVEAPRARRVHPREMLILPRRAAWAALLAALAAAALVPLLW